MATEPLVRDCTPAESVPLALSAEEAEAQARVLKAVAEPMRLRMLSLIATLGGSDVCACEFPGILGISQPTASHHLKTLTEAGLLVREQKGKWAHYSIVPERLSGLRNVLRFGG